LEGSSDVIDASPRANSFYFHLHLTLKLCTKVFSSRKPALSRSSARIESDGNGLDFHVSATGGQQIGLLTIFPASGRQ
jgi:hypothetical protein